MNILKSYPSWIAHRIACMDGNIYSLYVSPDCKQLYAYHTGTKDHWLDIDNTGWDKIYERPSWFESNRMSDDEFSEEDICKAEEIINS